jgi:beta-RFAP synthase
MTEEPGLEIVAECAQCWEVDGPLGERTLGIATSVASRLGERGSPVGPVRFRNVRAPEAHIGLGVGTQLSLAVARALTELAGLHQTPVETLARLTGRGLRSGIGIHGFAEGGLILDAGRRGEHQLPTRLIHLPFPETWSVLIVLPGRGQGLHGAEELNAFHSLPAMPEPTSDRLCRLVLLGLLPAVIEKDLESFGSALNEIQQIVGRTFAPVQGGRFGNPHVESLIIPMTGLGLRGVGQSSWGPALYAFSDEKLDELERQKRALIQETKLEPGSVIWTKASASGATVTQL